MLDVLIFPFAQALIEVQEKSTATASGWRIFRIHDPKTIEVVVNVNCADGQFEVPILVNLGTGGMRTIEEK